MQKIRRDDNVLVLKGKDRGRTGQVRRVIPPAAHTDKFGHPVPGRIIVTGVNMVKRHMRPRGPQKPGGIIEREAPLSWANVALLCSACSKAVRVGFRRVGDRKVRYCKSCDANID